MTQPASPLKVPVDGICLSRHPLKELLLFDGGGRLVEGAVVLQERCFSGEEMEVQGRVVSLCAAAS